MALVLACFKAGIVMNSKSSHEIDMLNGPVLPRILEFALPLALSGILQLLFNAADVIVVGRFVGPEALAAVGSTGSMTSLLTNLFIGLSVGVNVVVATNYAAGKYNEVSRIVHTSVATALVSGVFIFLLGLLVAEPMLRLMGSPEEVLPLSVRYIKIYYAGMPFVMLYNFGSAVLRSIGDTKRPLVYITVAGVVNVVLNLISVIIFGLGVAGVAIATVASNVVSSTLVLIALIRETSCLHFEFKRLNLDPKIIGKFASVGIPAGIQSTLFAVSNVLIQSSVNSFGAIVMAGNSAAANLEGFQYTSMHSVYTAAITFIGQNIGAKKYSRIKKVVRSSYLCVILVSAVFMITYGIFGKNLLYLYTTDPEVVEAGFQRLFIFICGYWICGMQDTSSGFLRGMGYGTLPTIISLIGAVGFRILWIFTAFRATHSYSLLLWGYPISWILTWTAHYISFRIKSKKLPKDDEPATVS